jgi:hypothetical protein
MVLGDGGDATRILHDRHPDLLAGSAVHFHSALVVSGGFAVMAF